MSTNTNAPAKEQSKMGSLVKSFRRYYVPFIIAIILLIASVVFTILSPGYIRSLTNEISPVGKTAVDGNFVINMENVLFYAFRLIIFIGVSFIASFISGFILNTIIQKFSKDLRAQIAAKINRMPLDYYDTTQTGDILSVITNDVDTLSTSLQNSVSMLVQSGVMLVGVLIAMFLSCWQMSSYPLILATCNQACSIRLHHLQDIHPKESNKAYCPYG
jgi:ATP-binding cassette subfamily B protein